VEARVVMAMMQEMGEFVRSASSTIQEPVLRRLRERFASSGKPPENT
jgi:translation initiation factor IF-2